MELVCICREVDKDTGKIAAYPLKMQVTGATLQRLYIRSCLNPELRYFATAKENFYANENVILQKLGRKNLSKKILENMNLIEV